MPEDGPRLRSLDWIQFGTVQLIFTASTLGGTLKARFAFSIFRGAFSAFLNMTGA
jgi:hypothetical protein